MSTISWDLNGLIIMTSWHGIIFRITSPMWWLSTQNGWIFRAHDEQWWRPSNTELQCFFMLVSKTVEQTFGLLAIWDAMIITIVMFCFALEFRCASCPKGVFVLPTSRGRLVWKIKLIPRGTWTLNPRLHNDCSTTEPPPVLEYWLWWSTLFIVKISQSLL